MNKKLIGYRKMLGITQNQMANKLNMSIVSYNKKEKEKTEFTQHEMVNITEIIKAQIPNVTMDDIFFNQEVSKMLT